MNNVADFITSRLDGLRVQGERLLPDGTQLIFPAPEIAPEAWRFVLFAPVGARVIQEMEIELNARFPVDFKNFLNVWNGVKLFGYQINIWGKRKDYAREGDAAWQPFDLVGTNQRFGRPEGSPESIVYIGSVERGEKWIFLHLDGEDRDRVGSTSREFFRPEHYWLNFNLWLKSEFVRLWNESYGAS